MSGLIVDIDMTRWSSPARDQYCNAARRHQQLTDDGLIYRYDKDGKRVFYTAQEIEEQRSEAKAALDTYCTE